MILEKSLTVVLLCLNRFSRHRGKAASQNWQAESLHRSLPAELEHLVPIKTQETGEASDAHSPMFWALVQQAMTEFVPLLRL